MHTINKEEKKINTEKNKTLVKTKLLPKMNLKTGRERQLIKALIWFDNLVCHFMIDRLETPLCLLFKANPMYLSFKLSVSIATILWLAWIYATINQIYMYVFFLMVILFSLFCACERKTCVEG